MKIGLVSPASLPATQFGGILFLMLDIAREASKLGHDVTIYTTDLDFANNPHTFNKKLSKKEKIDNKLQDAISEEEIISEISQGYEAAEQADLEKTVEASEPTDNDSLDESQNIEEEPSTEVKEEGKQE